MRAYVTFGMRIYVMVETRNLETERRIADLPCLLDANRHLLWDATRDATLGRDPGPRRVLDMVVTNQYQYYQLSVSVLSVISIRIITVVSYQHQYHQLGS